MPLLLLPQAAPPGPPSISSAPITQVAEALASGTAQASSAFAATIAGNSMVVFIARSGGLATGAITSVVDSAGGNWTQLGTGAVSGGTFSRIECWWRQNCPAITGLTFNSATAQTTQYDLTQWAGLAALDVASPANSANASSTTQTTPAVNTNYPIELVFAAWHFQQTTTSGLTAGWTALTNFDDSTSGSGRAAYLITSNTGSYSTSLTLAAAKAAGVLTVALQGTAQAPVDSASIAITGSGVVGLTGTDTALPTVGMTGSAGISVNGQGSLPSAVNTSQTGTLSLTGTNSALGALPITGTAAVGVAGTGLIPSSVPISGSAAMAVGAVHSIPSTTAMTQSGSVNVTTAGNPTATIPIAGTATVSLAGSSTIAASSAMTGSAAVTLNGSGNITGTLSMTQAGTINVAATGNPSATLPITGSADLTVTGNNSALGAINITGSCVVSVTPASGAPVPGTPVTSANGNTQTNTSLSVAFPAAAVDTLMVIEISGDASGTGVAPTGMAAAGWTKLGEAVDTNTGTATSSSYTGVFWKTFAAGSTSGSASFSWTNAGQMCAICTPYTNYDPATPAVWLVGQEKLTSDTAYSVAGTTTDAGLLVTAFADRAGSTAFSALPDNARTTAIVGTIGSIITGRVSASVVPAGTAFTKTATGTNTSVGTSVAYTIRGSVGTGTATVPMTQAGTVDLAGNATGNTTVAMAQVGVVTVTGQQAVSAAVLMAQIGTVSVTPATRLQLWLSSPPYYVAHRGGDNDWVEMTRDAYTHAIANGATAINIDAVRCSTGEFVASHDTTTGRVFGTNLTIGSSSWTSLSGLTTTTGGFPIEKVADLLAAFPNVVVFVENKGNSSDDSAFLDMLDAAGGPGRIVVKQYYTASAVATDAHARGYTTWGYYFAGADVTNLASTQSRWDLLGLDYTDTNSADWTSIKSYGKKVLGHVIPSAAGAAQAFSEGADGIMTGKILGVVPGNQQTAALSMSQTGAVAVSPALAHAGAMTMAQTATVGAVGLQTDSATLAVVQVATVALASSGSTTGAIAVAQTGAVALSATVSGSVVIPMTQTGGLSVAGRQTTTGAVAVAQVGSVALAGAGQMVGAMPMSQAAAIGLAGIDTVVAAGLISQAGAVSLAGRSVQTAAVMCTQAATLSAIGTQAIPAAAAVLQSGDVVVTGSVGLATSLPMQQATAVAVTSAVARLASIAITGTGLLGVTGTALAPVTAAVGIRQVADLALGGIVVEAAALPMVQSSGVGSGANVAETPALSLTGSGVVALAAFDQLIGFLAISGTSQLSLAGIGVLATALTMASVGTLDVGAVEFTPPLDTAAIPITGQAAISLTGVAVALAGLMVAQSSQVDVGAGVLIVRRHINVTAGAGVIPWRAIAVSNASRWSASATAPVPGG